MRPGPDFMEPFSDIYNGVLLYPIIPLVLQWLTIVEF